MERLKELIDERLQSLQMDISSGTFKTDAELQEEIDRIIKVMTAQGVMYGIRKTEVQDYIEENFIEKAKKMHVSPVAGAIPKAPDNYGLKVTQENIENLIQKGDLEAAQEQIDDMRSILEDEEIVKATIAAGSFTQEDADYFMQVAIPNFEQQIEEQTKRSFTPENMTLGQRFKFLLTGQVPYNNQIVKLETKKADDKTLSERFFGWVSKNKGKIAVFTGAALLVGGIAIGSHLHNKADEPTKLSTNQTQMIDGQIEMATFEVDEEHNFNVNDEQTHIENLKLLAKAFIERGVPVVSEEECMRLSNEGKLAVSPQQLDNWYISINLEDMDDLTFTKLLADSNTDKEELSSDFARVSNILGSIYTTKEDEPFIYQFIADKEYSAYIKSYEEAIIQNQKGNQEDLVSLIKSRVVNPVAGTSSGPIGMLSTSLIYQQANVYNARVIGQDIMNLYNINNDCKTEITTTFYSDDWAEYMRKVNSKLEAAIAYTGSEEEAYIEYLKTLTDDQDDNKVYIEDQVLLYLEKENITLGEWDLIDEIANDREVTYQGSGTGSNTKVTSPKPTGTATTSTESIVPKAPTTAEEKAVQAQVEKELEEKNRTSFEDTVKDYAEQHGASVTINKDGDFVISQPGETPIIVDGSTMGAYDASKDYQGTIYDSYKDYRKDHKDDVEYVEDVGRVVVTDESDIKITNPNVYEDKHGNIRDEETGERVIIGTKDEMEDYLEDNPELGEWQTVETGKIHYSDVDDDLSDYYTTPTLGNVSYAPSAPQSTTVSTSKPSNSQNTVVSKPVESSTPNGVDEDIYNSLTAEEQAALEEMLNAGKTPVAGEIVEETFSDVVYGSYTVTQLMNNPALCKNVPESVLKNDFPEIWRVYQNWLEEQKIVAEEQSTREQELKQQVPASEPTVQSEEIIVSDAAAQRAALEAARAELLGTEETIVEDDVKAMH